MNVAKILAVSAFLIVANVLCYMVIVEAGKDSYPKPEYVEASE